MTFACIIPAMFLSEFELAPNIVITSLFYLNRCQLLLREYRAEVVWIYTGIVTSSLFRVDMPLSHKCVGFSAQMAWAEMVRLNWQTF